MTILRTAWGFGACFLKLFPYEVDTRRQPPQVVGPRLQVHHSAPTDVEQKRLTLQAQRPDTKGRFRTPRTTVGAEPRRSHFVTRRFLDAGRSVGVRKYYIVTPDVNAMLFRARYNGNCVPHMRICANKPVEPRVVDSEGNGGVGVRRPDKTGTCLCGQKHAHSYLHGCRYTSYDSVLSGVNRQNGCPPRTSRVCSCGSEYLRNVAARRGLK